MPVVNCFINNAEVIFKDVNVMLQSSETKNVLLSSSMTDVYEQRLALLRDKCRKYQELPFSAHSETEIFMRADEKYNYFFCFIPKASSSPKAWLMILIVIHSYVPFV